MWLKYDFKNKVMGKTEIDVYFWGFFKSLMLWKFDKQIKTEYMGENASWYHTLIAESVQTLVDYMWG